MNNGIISNSRVLLTRITQQQQQANFQMQNHQQSSLKCPRCDSLNTKFCYYNNYNLSQPRHFCKNCRRYWTKGGVLRNVPVGGGCRKSKRSSSSSSSSSSNKSNKSLFNSSSVNNVTTTAAAAVNSVNNSNGQNSHSSSDSSSATPAIGSGSLFQIPEVENFGMSADLFSGGEIEGFMNLISENKHDDNNNKNNNGNVVSTASFSEFLQSQEWDMGKICGGVHGVEKIAGAIDLDNPTDRIEDLLQSRGSNVGLATLDWYLTAGNNQGSLFDFPDNSSTVDHRHDHQGCWGQSTVDRHHDSQWSDSTTSHLPLFLP